MKDVTGESSRVGDIIKDLRYLIKIELPASL